MTQNIFPPAVPLLPPEALLGLVVAAERLGGSPQVGRNAFRISDTDRQACTMEELAGLAADSDLIACAARADRRPLAGEVLLLYDEDVGRVCVIWLGQDGEPQMYTVRPDESQIRVERVNAPRPARPGAALLLARKQHGAGAKGNDSFGLNWFWRRIKRHKREVRMVLFAACTIHVISLLSPLIFAALVDRVLPNQEQATLLSLVLLAGLLIVMDHLLRVQRDLKIAWVAARVDSLTAEETFRHLLRLPLRYFNTAKAGVIARNLRLNEDIREFITGPAVATAIKLLALPFALPLLFFLSWPLALTVLAAGFAMAVCLLFAWPPYRKELYRLTELEGVRQAMAVETIHGATTVKALAIEPALLGRWKPLSAEIAASNQRLANIGARTGAWLDSIQRSTDLVIVGFGIYLVMQGDLTVGALIAFKLIAGQVIDPMVHAANVFQQYQTVRRQIELLGDIMTAEPEPGVRVDAPLSAPRLTGGFRLDRVSFRYPGAVRLAVEDFTLEAFSPKAEGTIIAIVGESGSGKSTITKMLLGLYRPEAGNLKFAVQGNNGNDDASEGWADVADLHPEALRRALAIVAQDNQFFAGTIRENLHMVIHGPIPTEAATREALRLSCSSSFVEALPDGLNTRLEESASNLSGGERQRLSIGRALLRNPPILVLDEATSALDVETELAFRNNIRGFAQGRVLVIVAHRLNTIADADLIVVMRDGRIIESGTHDDLLSKGEPGNDGPSEDEAAEAVYARMWRAQQGPYRMYESARANDTQEQPLLNGGGVNG